MPGTLLYGLCSMKLTVDDVTRFFNVSEKTVYRWIKNNSLPALRVGQQFRFSRIDLIEWAAGQNLPVPADLINASDHCPSALPSLSHALADGGIYYNVEGNDKASVLAALVEHLPTPERVDRQLLLSILLAREELGSTAIGDGIALPHARNPIVLAVTHPAITLCFLARPIEFGALDGHPVIALFSLVSPTTHVHLHLLSRLTFALRDDAFKRAVMRQSPREALLAELARVEAAMPSLAPARSHLADGSQTPTDDNRMLGGH